MRKTTKLVVFLVMLHAAAALLSASGVAADMGVLPDPGGDEKIERAQSDAQKVEAEGGAVDTLFALYNSVTGSLTGFLNTAFALEIMLSNLGIPVYVTAFLAAPVPIIIGMDVVYLLTGRAM